MNRDSEKAADEREQSAENERKWCNTKKLRGIHFHVHTFVGDVQLFFWGG